MLNNVLVLSPHRDDECLGVGGTLFLCKNIHIHYFNDIHPNVPVQIYDQEAQEVQNKLGCSVSYSDQRAVNKLHLFPIDGYIAEIEKLLNTLRPTTIFIPCSSRNQDHRVVYEAAITATRFHDTNYLVPNVLIYEQTEYVTPEFLPTFFVSIDIDKKLELFNIYRSQQRGHRTPEHIKALATLRGMEINKPYAEAFQVRRIKYGK